MSPDWASAFHVLALLAFKPEPGRTFQIGQRAQPALFFRCVSPTDGYQLVFFGRQEVMSEQARQFIEFWIANSVHAAEQFGAPGASQDADALARRCIEMAKDQGIPEAEMRVEVGDIASYIRGKLIAANETEANRKDRR